MLDTTTTATGEPATRLQALLESLRPALDEETLAEARALGPELVTDLVRFMVDRALSPNYGSYAAIRAVHLAGELRLAGAAPVLARCLPFRDRKGELRQAALGALARLGRPGTDALLDAFERSGTVMERAELAELLACLDASDDRIRTALLRVVDDVPEHGAGLLVRRGDWRAVPELLRRLDQLPLGPPGHCTLCTVLGLEALQAAVRTLGGVITDEQYERLDEATEAVEREEDGFADQEDSSNRAAPSRAARASLPGRNAPCHCGSGRKYKKCCLPADERRQGH